MRWPSIHYKAVHEMLYQHDTLEFLRRNEDDPITLYPLRTGVTVDTLKMNIHLILYQG